MDVGAGLSMYDVVVKKFTFVISSPDEFLYCLDALADIRIREKALEFFLIVLPRLSS